MTPNLLPGPMEFAVMCVLGAIVGSFANVCIHRIPRGESIVRPASHCPSCHTSIPWYHNLPIFSYLVLAGRCRYCRERISPRYLAVEVAAAAVFVLLWWRVGWSAVLPAYLVLFTVLLIISFIDLDHQIIPDVLSLPGIVAGLLASLLVLPHGALWAVIGGLVGGGVLYAVAVLGGLILKQEAMGGGDIKLMAMIGAFLGWRMSLLTIIFAAFLGSIIGGGAILLLRRGRRTPIPFGP